MPKTRGKKKNLAIGAWGKERDTEGGVGPSHAKKKKKKRNPVSFGRGTVKNPGGDNHGGGTDGPRGKGGA